MSLFRFPNIQQKIIKDKGEVVKAAVVPCINEAGASYVSAKLVKEGLIAHHTPSGMRSLVELGNPYFYEALGMEKRFAGREFFEFESAEKYCLNMEFDINWYLRKKWTSMDSASLFKVVSMAPGNLIIYDCSGIQNESVLEKILCEMDVIYLVIDPLPTKLFRSEAFIRDFKRKYPKAILVVNKFNKGVHRGQLSAFLGTGNYYTVDAVDLSHIYMAEFNCILP